MLSFYSARWPEIGPPSTRGVGVATVDRVLNSVPKGKNSNTEHVEAAPRPSRADAIKADLAEMESPAGQRWNKALAALHTINEQASVEAMFADRYRRVDHAVGPELTRDHRDGQTQRQ